MTRVALIPGVLALLPQYAGLVDPVAELRAACRDAVAWLAEDGRTVTIVADAQGQRVAEAFLDAGPRALHADSTGLVGALHAGSAGSVLVVANGSARRGEKAPGHVDDRAHGFDTALDTALRTPDPTALSALDERLGAELLAGNVPGLRALGGLLSDRHDTTVGYADDPFGVQYWVMRWACAS